MVGYIISKSQKIHKEYLTGKGFDYCCVSCDANRK